MAKRRALQLRVPSTIAVGFVLFVVGMLAMAAGKIVHDHFSSYDGSAIFFAGCAILIASCLVAGVGHFRNPPQRR